MNSSHLPSSLQEVLQHPLITHAQQWGAERLAVAPPVWKANTELPEGMTMSRAALKGRNKKIRSLRPYGSASLFDAVWPADQLHSARAPVLCFVIQGPLAYRISNYVLHCESGHGILMPPGLPFADGTHRFLDDTKMHQGSCVMLQMQPYHEGLFCWRTQRWLDERGRLQHNEQNSSLHGSLVPGYLYQLMEEMQRPQQYRQMICDSLLRLLLGTLHRELQDLPVFETGELFTSSHPHKTQHSITQIEEYIQQNLARDLTIEKMAQRAFMSRTAFTKKFRARTEKSLIEYVTDLRVEKARDLLRGTDLAVRQVAAAVGLEQNRLRVLFLQREGVPPSLYRENHRKTALK